MAKKRAKVRTEFRKNHQGRVRQGDYTRDFQRGDKSETLADLVHDERFSGKGELTRKRTVIGADASAEEGAGLDVRLGDREGTLKFGCVLSVHGLRSRVLGDDGLEYMCIVRQLLKSLTTDQRNVVATGDRVGFSAESPDSGMIERIEPRHGVLSRTSKGRQHVIVTNVDYLLIVASCAQPGIKPALIDRYLLTAEQYGIRPIICLNKIDLVDPASLQQIAGTYAQLGYRVLMTSAETGVNIDYLRSLLAGKQTAIAGQSGVGKSSLLNSIEPTLALRVGIVSRENEKGKHTTTAARLIPLVTGGAVIDTPGIRQFQLWDISASEVAALMPDLRPYVSDCRYPDCLHLNEDECAVKDAVADARIDARRYDSYCHIIEDELSEEK
jgi:ribosome biogenesis GTPase